MAESRVRDRSANGPLRVRMKNRLCLVFCNVRHTSVVGDMLVSQEAHGIFAMNQGGTADRSYSSLTEPVSVMDFFVFMNLMLLFKEEKYNYEFQRN
jgi:hypothetical protein